MPQAAAVFVVASWTWIHLAGYFAVYLSLFTNRAPSPTNLGIGVGIIVGIGTS
jgi:hypothetical protein